MRRDAERANLNFAGFRMKRQIHLAAPPMITAVRTEPHARADRSYANRKWVRHDRHLENCAIKLARIKDPPDRVIGHSAVSSQAHRAVNQAYTRASAVSVRRMHQFQLQTVGIREENRVIAFDVVVLARWIENVSAMGFDLCG
jgi:hypothetical protein